jgi:uncharacterized membrane protein
MTLYDLIKYVHVLAAITAVGLNLSYGVWLTLGERSPENRVFVLRTVKRLDDWLANPAYVLLLLSGLGMVWVGSLALTTTWIAVALVLYVALVIIGLGVFSRSLSRQISVLASGAVDGATYAAINRRTTVSGVILVLIALAIVFLMVVKPGA